jgi:hypothetical protein
MQICKLTILISGGFDFKTAAFSAETKHLQNPIVLFSLVNFTLSSGKGNNTGFPCIRNMNVHHYTLLQYFSGVIT